MKITKEVISAVDFAYSQLRSLIGEQPERIEAEVNQFLGDLIQQARKLKFWHERLGSMPSNATIASFQSNVPLLTRAEIQQSAGRLRLRIPNTSTRDYFTTRTSGSTGKPVEVLKFSPSQFIQSAVVTLLRREWANLDIKKNYLRLRNGVPDATHHSWGFPYTLLGETGRTHVIDVAKTSFEDILNFIQDHEISYVHGNTTMMKSLAFQAQVSGLSPSTNLELSLTWAERVTSEDRRLIRNNLGIDVYDSYSSEEMGNLAMQCVDGDHLHSLPFFNYLEILDSDNQPCSVGQTGRLVATSLHNFAQPMIRYELGDLASFGEPCPRFPGLSVIQPEVTRTRDVYTTASGKKMIPRFGNARFVGYKGIQDFQVILCADAVVFMYSSAIQFDPIQERDIKEDVGRQFDFDKEVFIRRMEIGELFSQWKRKVFYTSEASVASLMRADSKTLHNLIKTS